ncbi:Glucans biosynthesis glucosyltransferase H [Caulifigura coniformis]|uniref:Glucans biosynthesis glucosyltransferase H n=1 Tax=Caulifigura coniformis TaxID=2527983 RepID=A0A517SFG3_9PLAN|nr:glucans biosynthesis glucosyltransferase MdoH [Caulifigura coniformis]QDT54866.1 Glucans biosynthesis glucosyltransferase H [Caulifigura coniformis]
MNANGVLHRAGEFLRRPGVARVVLCLLTVATTAYALNMFSGTLIGGGMNMLERLLLPLFAVLFAWIALSFWTATLGFVVTMLGVRRCCAPATNSKAAPVGRSAVLIPVYNESPADVFASVDAMLKSLDETGHAGQFDLFVLSDTTNPDIWLEEERTWAALVSEGRSGARVFYRRRPKNTSRKAGNIADFCTRWGAHYSYMIVLDADSLMEGETFCEMARRMDADAELGILQVPPTPINRMSFFARLQQFAARLYGPVFIQGFATWAHYDSNYWGHNAIIRIEPFMKHCGLPVLPGKAPLGGEILSHDFVEAALMRRAGYKVCLADDLDGSYEECPTKLIDFAKRDQRWCQGNMQHIRLVFSEGFLPISRFHLACGAMSYLASPLWMLFMVLGGLAMIVDQLDPVSRQRAVASAASVFALSMALLILPKVYSVIALVRDRAKLAHLGGWRKVIGSVLIESLVSMLIAPIMMLFHTRFVVATLMGESVQWNAQNRGEGGFSLIDSMRDYRTHTLVGLAATAIVAFAAPHLLLWFLPVVFGLVLSVPVTGILDSLAIGQWLARRRLLLIPEEASSPRVVRLQKQAARRREQSAAEVDRSRLFLRVLIDPSFHALHQTILQATDSHLPIAPAELRAAKEVFEKDGPEAMSVQSRRMILSDANALKEFHIRARTRQRAAATTTLAN